MTNTKVTDLDIYGILEIDITATTADIRRAYRKKALHCHPDKNPDPKAAELFQNLTKALEILLDDAARTQYDNLLKAREAAKLRNNALNAKRRKLKEDLEERERAAASWSEDFVSEEEKIKNDIERLRKDGEKLVQEEISRLQEEVLNELKAEKPSRDISLCQLKATWADKGDTLYSKEALSKIFSKYGDIVELAVLSQKALVEFEDSKAAELAVKIEIGFVESPLKVTYASKKHRSRGLSSATTPFQNETISQRSARQLEERKRLIEEMLKQDASED